MGGRAFVLESPFFASFSVDEPDWPEDGEPEDWLTGGWVVVVWIVWIGTATVAGVTTGTVVVPPTAEVLRCSASPDVSFLLVSAGGVAAGGAAGVCCGSA